MLLMEQYKDRGEIEKYFYGGGSVGCLAPLLIIVGIGLMATGVMMMVGIPVVCVGILMYFFKSIGKNERAEKAYDECVKVDLEYLKKRAVESVGLVDEEYSLIEPIVTVGFAPANCVNIAVEQRAQKHSGNFLLSLLKDMIVGILKVIFKVPIAIWKFFKNSGPDVEHVSEPVFYEGSDDKVRASLRNVTIVVFTENQAMIYYCNYDIAIGIILEEYVREVFYRDIDSVNYGDETVHVWSEAKMRFLKVVQNRFWFQVPSSSGGIGANYIGDNAIIRNQITAAKSLIRSKKEEMA